MFCNTCSRSCVLILLDLSAAFGRMNHQILLSHSVNQASWVQTASLVWHHGAIAPSGKESERHFLSFSKYEPASVVLLCLSLQAAVLLRFLLDSHISQNFRTAPTTQSLQRSSHTHWGHYFLWLSHNFNKGKTLQIHSFLPFINFMMAFPRSTGAWIQPQLYNALITMNISNANKCPL